MVFTVVASLAGLVKVHSSKVLTDDAVFRLHYRWTTSLCFLACGLVATTDLIGEPIQCLMGGQEAPKPITTYCWVTSTFTIYSNDAMGENDVLLETPHRQSIQGAGLYDKHKHSKKVHTYYQFVPFVLFIMGCMFYLPHLLWKEIESKQVDSLLQGLNILSIDECANKKKENIINYMYHSQGLNYKYSVVYFIMQVVNLANVIIVMLFLEMFFGGIFMNYGLEVVKYLQSGNEMSHNPMVYAFPRLAKCTFSQFGPSGSIERLDVFCLLPQNILNEKIFLFLWFWLVILTVLSAMKLVYMALLFLSPALRQLLLEHHGMMISSPEMSKLVHSMHLGDYFLLLTLSRNLDALCFKDILEALVRRLLIKDDLPEAPASMFKPLAPTYRHFQLDEEEDPVAYKRNLERNGTAL